MKSSELIEIINSIQNPLSYEPKNGFKDQTVVGGFSSFALRKIDSIQQKYLSTPQIELIHTLEKATKEYQNSPSESTFQKLNQILDSIKKIVTPFKSVYINQDLARNDLAKPIQFIKGIGPKRAKLFEKLGIFTLFDLLYFFPRDYLDLRKIISLSMAKVSEFQTFMGTIIDVKEFLKGNFSIINIIVYDRTGYIQLTFFNQKYLLKIFKEHIQHKIIFSGKVQYQYNKFCIDSPEYEFLEEDKETIHTGRIVPIYRLTAGLNGKSLRVLIKNQLDLCQGNLYEFIPVELLSKQMLPVRSKAIQNLHFPEDSKLLEAGRKRIVFEEFLLGQYRLNKIKNRNNLEKGILLHSNQKVFEAFTKSLPFILTNSQQKALQEIMNDLNSGKPMNRLLHGEVGSGKTAVAAFLFFLCSKNERQSAFMAPTEILARQSFHVLQKFLEHHDIKVGLLISEMKEKEKNQCIQKLESGEINVIVGTHALIQEKVSFKELALVIVDEQHRFGVKQRLSLKNKGTIPHMLVMSATPIPRSVAMTRYGDLDISVLNEIPGGDRKVTTKIVEQNHLPEIYEFMRKEINKGAKVYVVCPLIEESDKIEAASSILKAEEMKAVFPELNVLLLHGRMSSQEKEEVMNVFKTKEGNILVSTTVIEVGIDIPEASVILIENAERFGLAQLHQLRGRVGRKSQQSWCFLSVSSRESKNRLNILEQTNSGFSIAEEDLEQRGPGELFGEKQSGFVSVSLIQMDKDIKLLEAAKETAMIISANPKWSDQLEKEIEFRQTHFPDKEIVTIG